MPLEIGRRVVLFGSTGFVGSHIAAALHGIDVAAPEWPVVDITKPDSLRGVLQPEDVVVNAAGCANATDTTRQGRALFQAVNVDGVRNLAQAAVEAGATQLVHISTVAAMGRLQGEGIVEEMSGPITSPYAQSKRDGEHALADFQGDLAITILRPTLVFGEGRGLPVTLCTLVSKCYVPLPLGGAALIPFTYIGNVARAVELTLGNPRCFGRTFIVGDRRSYPLRDVVMEIGRAMGVRVRVIPLPRIVALAGVLALETAAAARGRAPLLDRFRLDTLTRSVSYSIGAFEDAVGFHQPYSFERAIDILVKWYLAEQAKKPQTG